MLLPATLGLLRSQRQVANRDILEGALMNVRTIAGFCAAVFFGFTWQAAAAAPAPASIPPPLSAILRTERLSQAGDLGQGVRVGVISGGDGNYATLVRHRILPGNVSLFGNTPGHGDEGDWMLQVVHDIAPKAQLAFCPGGAPAQTVACARALVEKFRADIVVDDINPQPIFYFPTAKASGLADIAHSHPNVLFFTGAGNNGGGYYQGSWTPSPLTVRGTPYLAQDFGRSLGEGSSPYNRFLLPPGSGAAVLLGSTVNPNGGAAHCAASNPRVTLILMGSEGNVLRSATSRCPSLHLHYVNSTGQAEKIRIAVLLPQNAHAGRLAIKLVAIRTGEGVSPFPLRFHTAGGAGNSATFPGLMAVAGVDPNSGYDGRYIDEAFANSGPQCLDYIQTGPDTWHRLSQPACVEQPVFSTPDKTLVAFPASTPTGYRFRPFGGDSAAGPAAAGVAALLLADHVPSGSIEKILERSALPQAGKSAWTANYGYGLIDADAAAVDAGILPPAKASDTNAQPAGERVFRPSVQFVQDRKLVVEAEHGKPQALATLQGAAQHGQPDAQIWLAIYEHGKGDNAAAAHWAWESARQGQAVAQSFLGTVFNLGWGVPIDPRAAHAWWLRSARAGVPEAMYDLGITWATGRGAAVPDPVLGYALIEASQRRGFHLPSMHAAMGRVRSQLSPAAVRRADTLARQLAADPTAIP